MVKQMAHLFLKLQTKTSMPLDTTTTTEESFMVITQTTEVTEEITTEATTEVAKTTKCLTKTTKAKLPTQTTEETLKAEEDKIEEEVDVEITSKEEEDKTPVFFKDTSVNSVAKKVTKKISALLK